METKEITAVQILSLGGSTCDVDKKPLTYSWYVKYSDGTSGHYCTNHCPGVGDVKP